MIAVEEVWINQSQAGLMRAGQPLGWHKQHLIIHDGDKKLAALEVFNEAADRWQDELQAAGLLEDRFVSND
ncbi:hypothetical protein [Bradyrhizobium sp. STM 3561]|uniref:hypothetical protein n=1 Tax=Bradyrhizobium sp. STM 3561 TaxID=578923 RepID=UPI00388FF445